MIACEKAQEKISCLVDNELSESDRLEVTEHIKTCPECKAIYDAFSAVSDNLGELEDAPDNLTEKVMSAVKTTAPQEHKTPWVKYLSVAACLALVIFAGTKLYAPNGGIADDTATADCPEAGEAPSANAPDSDMYTMYDAQENSACDSAAENCIIRSDGLGAALSDEFVSHLKTHKDLKKYAIGEKSVPDYTVITVDGDEYDIFINGDTVAVSCGDDFYISALTVDEIENLFE